MHQRVSEPQVLANRSSDTICTLIITQSRIDTKLIAVPKQFAPMFPEDRREIAVWLDGAPTLEHKRFTPGTGSTRECRIYGVSAWYKARDVRAGDRVVIELLSRGEWLYNVTHIRSGDAPTTDTLVLHGSDATEPPRRTQATITRIARDTTKSRRLKQLYEYRCQVCGTCLELTEGMYLIEVHHLRPLGGEHQGLDDFGNMMVLCPNHHALFDYGVPSFLSPTQVQLTGKIFLLESRHVIDEACIEYHNNRIRD